MYTYSELLDDVNFLSRYGVETGAIGASVNGRIIPYAAFGSGEKSVIVTAGIHAREHVSSLFAVKQAYEFKRKPPVGFKLYIAPMLNPDGNVLVSEGAEAFGFDGARLIDINGSSKDFSLWKANARGVDLNVNFDAEWGTGVQNVHKAASANYIGEKPFSEPETRAIAEFTQKISPVLTLSYHAKGHEIYYEFGQSGAELERDRAVARYAAELTGFKLVNGTQGSAGGYKDWCVLKLGIPSLTLELAPDSYSHPLEDASIADDFARFPRLAEQLYEYLSELQA